jgi:hypothetical protein
MSVFVTPVSSTLSPVTVKKFSSITGVPNSTETTIFSRVSLADETFGDLLLGGTDYARFNIYINSTLQFVVRTGPERFCNLSLQRPLQVMLNDIMDVKVIHYNAGVSADFEATLLGV